MFILETKTFASQCAKIKYTSQKNTIPERGIILVVKWDIFYHIYIIIGYVFDNNLLFNWLIHGIFIFLLFNFILLTDTYRINFVFLLAGFDIENRNPLIFFWHTCRHLLLPFMNFHIIFSIIKNLYKLIINWNFRFLLFIFTKPNTIQKSFDPLNTNLRMFNTQSHFQWSKSDLEIKDIALHSPFFISERSYRFNRW